jgi:hypothetical protein
MGAVVAALGLLLGISFFGDTPDTRDTTEQVAQYFVDNRTAVFVGVVVVGIGLMGLLAVAAREAEQLDGAGQPRAGRVVQSAATLVAAVVAVGLLLPIAGLAYVIGSDDPGSAKGIFDLTLVSTPIVALPAAVLLGTVALGGPRWGTSPRWFAALSAIGALLLAWAACSFAASGPMSPDVQQSVVFQVLVVWLIAEGIVRRSRRNAADA